MPMKVYLKVFNIPTERVLLEEKKLRLRSTRLKNNSLVRERSKRSSTTNTERS